jgi:anthranilate/para-aminobenzoate synthase component I
LQIDLDLSPAALCAVLRRSSSPCLFLDGAGESGDPWSTGPLVTVQPEICLTCPVDGTPDTSAALKKLQRMLRERRAVGGGAHTGVAVLLSYELFESSVPAVGRQRPALPALLALRIDRSVRFAADGSATLNVRDPAAAAEVQDRLLARIGDGSPGESASSAARFVGRPATSLPRERYLDTAERILRHIAGGDIYQANLCQRFEAPYRGDELALYRALREATPAPRSAFLETEQFALLSLSPEAFLRLTPPDFIETFPIKGTRPRGKTPAADRSAARELLASPKDRAELLMIVDLERNDLGRVCRTATVQTNELAALRSFSAVHHLVAHVTGRLRPEIGIDDLLRATFPGGSITGAPKLRAMQILRSLEPVRRHYFTGSLFWFGDDGSFDSSILIRTLVLSKNLARDPTGDRSVGRALLGAGGGIVADSDPLSEWHESNHKARALALGLGFDPEEAT